MSYHGLVACLSVKDTFVVLYRIQEVNMCSWTYYFVTWMHACFITRLCIVLFCKYNAHIRILHASALQTNCKQSGHCSQSTETMVCWGLSCNGNCLAVTSIFVFFTCSRADHRNWNRGCNRNDNNDNGTRYDRNDNNDNGTRYDRNDNNDNGTTDISNRLLNINNRLVLTL